MTTIADERPITDITPHHSAFRIDFRELWAYRELLFLFAWRDATIRYKQSVVGIGWAVIQPLTMMLIFTVVFGRFAKLPSDGVPYTVFTISPFTRSFNIVGSLPLQVAVTWFSSFLIASLGRRPLNDFSFPSRYAAMLYSRFGGITPSR